MSRPDRVNLGITLMVTAVFLMSIQEALFKQFSADLSLWQIFTLRGLLALPLLFIIAGLKNQGHSLWIEAMGKWPLLQSLFMTLVNDYRCWFIGDAPTENFMLDH